MQRFAVVGPPTVVFLNSETGSEIKDARVVGDVGLDNFLNKVAMRPGAREKPIQEEKSKHLTNIDYPHGPRAGGIFPAAGRNVPPR